MTWRNSKQISYTNVPIGSQPLGDQGATHVLVGATLGRHASASKRNNEYEI